MSPARLILLSTLSCILLPVTTPASDCSCDKVTISKVRLGAYSTVEPNVGTFTASVAQKVFVATQPRLGSDDGFSTFGGLGVYYETPDDFKLEVENEKPWKFVPMSVTLDSGMLNVLNLEVTFGCGVRKVQVGEYTLSVEDKDQDIFDLYWYGDYPVYDHFGVAKLKRDGCRITLSIEGWNFLEYSNEPLIITPFKPKGSTCPITGGASAPPSAPKPAPSAPDLNASFPSGTGNGGISPGLIGWSATTAADAVSFDSLAIPGQAPAGAPPDSDYTLPGTEFLPPKTNGTGVSRLQYTSQTQLFEATKDGDTLTLRFFPFDPAQTPAPTIDWDGTAPADFHATTPANASKTLVYDRTGDDILVTVDNVPTHLLSLSSNSSQTTTSWHDLLAGEKRAIIRTPGTPFTVETREFSGPIATSMTLVSRTTRTYEVETSSPDGYRAISTRRHATATGSDAADHLETLSYSANDPSFIESRVGNDGTWSLHAQQPIGAFSALSSIAGALTPGPESDLTSTSITARPWLGSAPQTMATLDPTEAVVDVTRSFANGTTISETFTTGIRTAKSKTFTSETGVENTEVWSSSGQSTTSQRVMWSSENEWAGRLYRTIQPGGSCTTYTYAMDGENAVTTATEGTLDSPDGLTGKSTRTVTTTSPEGEVLSEVLQIRNGSGYETASTTTYSRVTTGQQTVTTTTRDGRVVSVVTTTPTTTTSEGEDGQTTTTTESEGQTPGQSVESGYPNLPDLTTTFARSGLTTTTTRSAAGVPPLVSSSTRNLLGETDSSTDEAGTVSTRTISRAGDLSTTTETSTTNGISRSSTRHRDGQFHSAGGNGQIARRASYAIDSSNGFLIATESTGPVENGQTHSPRKTITTTDWTGRVLQTQRPAAPGTLGTPGTGALNTTTQEYDSQGRPTKTSDTTGTAPSLTLYHPTDPYTVTSGQDVNNDGALTAGVDRFSISSRSYVQIGGAWWVEQTTATPTNATTSLVYIQREKLHQGDGTVSVAIDPAGNTSTTTRVFNRAARIITSTTVTAVGETSTVQTNGVLTSSTVPGATRPTAYVYDGLRRLIRQTDVRGATTWYEYDASGHFRKSTGHLGHTITREYYPSGHVNAGQAWKTTDHGGGVTETIYDNMGRVIAIDGNASYPQAFTYNDFGDMETLVTSGTQTATTTWHHDPATGRVVKKLYTDGSKTLYAYLPNGRLAQRQWERGVTTTWGYNPATGDLESITHSDDTFDVAYAGHDIFGRPANVTETRNGVPSATALTYQPFSGAVSTSYATNHPILPNLSVIAHDDDARGRPTGHAAKQSSNTVHSWTHTYDSHGRLGAVTGHNLTATLGYYPGTGLLKSQSTTSGTNTILTRSTNLDLLGRTYGVIQTAPDPDVDNTPRVVTALAHTHDSRHRRETARRDDGTQWTYGYNDRSEVTAAAKRLANSDLVPGLEFGYSYDGLGNRLQATRGTPALTTGYTPDAMNRYETITTPGGDDILVRSDVPVTITADTQSTTQTTAGNFHNGRATTDNEPNGAWTEINVTATGFNHTGHRWTPPATVSPEYDDDGNLVSDGRWTYTWDAMNRLVGLTPTANALTAGVPNETITHTYDHLSRRIGKKVVTTTSGNTTTKETRYLYENWNVVAEFTVESGELVPSATYLWSQDLSGSLQGAGGVGGLHSVNLLPSSSGASVFLPGYDANGNIIAWTDTTGRVAQRQDYDPFGNLVILERHPIGAETSARLTYGFSTKPLEEESGFHYYGYRFYDGRNGRWINRDPVAERGGANLYSTLSNNVASGVDILGKKLLVMVLPAGWEFDPETNAIGGDSKTNIDTLRTIFKINNGLLKVGLEKTRKFDSAKWKELGFKIYRKTGPESKDLEEIQISKEQLEVLIQREMESGLEVYLGNSKDIKIGAEEVLGTSDLTETFDQFGTFFHSTEDEGLSSLTEENLATHDLIGILNSVTVPSNNRVHVTCFQKKGMKESPELQGGTIELDPVSCRAIFEPYRYSRKFSK